MEQLEIVGRYLERIRRMYNGNNSLDWDDRHFQKDDVYSFFIHCNHLRDWVLKLNKIGIKKTDVKEFIKRNKPIQICADLANYSKHCKLMSETWSGDTPYISETIHQSANMQNDIGVESKFFILVGSEIVDALELAEQCWDLWDQFIQKTQKSSYII